MTRTPETATPERPGFLLIGGHPAIDFTNTLVLPPGPGVEFLQSWPDVVAWLAETKLSDEKNLHVSKSTAPQALEAVRALRQAWKAALADLMAGHHVRPAFLQQLNTLLQLDIFTEILHTDGKEGFHLHRSPSRLQGEKLALALLARSIAEFLATADFQYLRRCANADSCVLNFYDTTKNHRRQWCSTAVCGNRHKVSEFRRRQRRARRQKA